MDDAVVGGDLVAARVLAGLGYPLDRAWARLVPDLPMAAFTTHREWRRLPYEPGRHPCTLLVCDPDPQVLTDEMRPGVVVAATLDHPVAELARAKILAHRTDGLVHEVCEAAELHPGLAAFCQRHELMPVDPIRRARFLLLTGQLRAYRAFDPDGELFARAYVVAPEDDKAAMRERLLRTGDAGIIRSLVDRAAEIVRLDEQAVTRLGRALAERRDWPALWRLVRDVSVVAATGLVPLFEPGWRPVTEPERHLLGALRSTAPKRLASVKDQPSLLHRIEADHFFWGVSVAPGCAELAAWWPSDRGVDVGLFDLATGEAIRELSWNDGGLGARLAHCGAAVVADHARQGLVRHVDGRAEPLADGYVRGLASAAGNFAALLPDGVLIGGSGHDELVRVPAAQLGLGDVASSHTPASSAASSDGSRFAFAAVGRLVVLDAAGAVLARSRGDVVDLAFLGPTELVTSGHDHVLRRWRLTAGDRVGRCVVARQSYPTKIVGLPGVRRLVCEMNWSGLDILDGETLESRHDEMAALKWQPADRVALAGDGDSSFALAGRATAGDGSLMGVVEVHDLRRLPLRRLLDRPVATMRLEDLRTAASLAAAFDDPAVRVLHAALAHRFGREVSLGAVRVRADDITVAVDDGGGAPC